MTKKYSPVTNEQRRFLVKLIYEDGMSIRQAAIASKIYYPTAKAINKIYISEKRVDKKKSRFRKIANNKPSSAQKVYDAEDLTTKDYKLTMLKPIREELSLGPEIYESLDEAMIDVTEERVEESRRQNMPFNHFLIINQRDSKQALTHNYSSSSDQANLCL